MGIIYAKEKRTKLNGTCCYVNLNMKTKYVNQFQNGLILILSQYYFQSLTFQSLTGKLSHGFREWKGETQCFGGLVVTRSFTFGHAGIQRFDSDSNTSISRISHPSKEI